MNKYTHPFLLGLIFILISFFLTFVSVVSPINELSEIKVSASMFDYAFAGKPQISAGAELDNMIGGSEMSMAKSITVPRFLGIYYTVIFLLCLWGILIYLTNDQLRPSNKKSIVIGIAGLLLLSVLVTSYEISYYKDAFNLNDSLQEYYKIKPGIGLFVFFAGLIAAFIGAFKHFQIKDTAIFNSAVKLKPLDS